MAKQDGPQTVNWDRYILIAILSASGGGQLLGGLGQGRVVDQLQELKGSVDKLLDQRKEYERFRDEMTLKVNDLELALRHCTFPSQTKP